MQIDAKQVEQIQTMLYKENASVTFFPKGRSENDGYWYVTNDRISEAGKWIEKEDSNEFYEDRETEDFVKFAQKQTDLTAVVNLDGARGSDETFEDWEHLARYMGITDLVVLSTKVPKKISEKFTYYATKDTTVSNQLRKMVYDFVVESIKENAEKDAFR